MHDAEVARVIQATPVATPIPAVATEMIQPMEVDTAIPYGVPVDTSAPMNARPPVRKPANRSNESKIKTVIFGQKLLVYAAILYFVLIGTLFGTGAIVALIRGANAKAGEFAGMAILIFLLVGILAMLVMAFVGLFKLGRVIMGKRWFLVLPLLLLPGLSLILILFINARANRFLKFHGYEIGMMGAKLR